VYILSNIVLSNCLYIFFLFWLDILR